MAQRMVLCTIIYFHIFTLLIYEELSNIEKNIDINNILCFYLKSFFFYNFLSTTHFCLAIN